MPSFSHESYSTKPDENGHRLRLSIDALFRSSKRKSPHFRLYKGMALSSGTYSDDRHRKIMVVKFLSNSLDNDESEDFASHMVNLNRELETVARCFNNYIEHMLDVISDLPWRKRCNRIHFQKLQMGQLESVSFCNRKRRKGEFFVFGEKLESYKMFLDTRRGIYDMQDGRDGRKRRRSVNYGEETPRRKFKLRTYSLRDVNDDVPANAPRDGHASDCLNAFVHFYFCNKNRMMALDCLRGTFSDERGYTLTTPVIHSMSGDYGPLDDGERGLRQIIKDHRCNALCKHLPDMKQVLDNAICNSKSIESAYETAIVDVDENSNQEIPVYMNICPFSDHGKDQDGGLYPKLPSNTLYGPEEGAVFDPWDALLFERRPQGRQVYYAQEIKYNLS